MWLPYGVINNNNSNNNRNYSISRPISFTAVVSLYSCLCTIIVQMYCRPTSITCIVCIFYGNCQSTLCLFVLLYCINILSTVVNNHFEHAENYDDDDDDDDEL